MSDGRYVDDEFFLTVNPKELVGNILIVGSNSTGSTVNRLSGKIKVLADMAGINGNDFMGSLRVSPLCTDAVLQKFTKIVE
jgi:hypothetical protein